jgi:hypothetical protein
MVTEEQVGATGKPTLQDLRHSMVASAATWSTPVESNHAGVLRRAGRYGGYLVPRSQPDVGRRTAATRST